MPASSLNFNLPFSGMYAQGNLFAGMGGDPQQAMANLPQIYQQGHNATTAFNEKMYQSQQTGMDQVRNDTNQIYDNVFKNLDSLYGDVIGGIAGTNTSNIRDIEANARAQSAASTQSLINRGLGNTTVMNSANRGINADRTRETTRSNEQFAQLGAGYKMGIGQARIGAQQNKAQQMGGLGVEQMRMLGQVSAPYQDPQAFMQMAQMYGASAESDRNRKQLGGSQFTGGYGATAGTISPPSPFGSRNPAGSGGGSWGGDSWTGGGSFGGGYGGGFYQPQGAQRVDQGQTTYNNYGATDPYAAGMGNAAAFGGAMGGGYSTEDYYGAGESGMSDAYLDEIGFY